MGTLAFDSLFTGYADNDHTRRSRNQFKQALASWKLQLERLRRELQNATLDNLDPVKEAISTLDQLTLNFVPETPPAVLMSLDLIGRPPLLVASRAFHAAMSKKHGMFRKTGIITQDELALCKRELDKSAEQILSWINYVTPDS